MKQYDSSQFLLRTNRRKTSNAEQCYTYFSNFYKMCQYFSPRLHCFTWQNFLLDPEIHLKAEHNINYKNKQQITMSTSLFTVLKEISRSQSTSLN